MIRFEDIIEKVERHHPGSDIEALRKAYLFSATQHRGQVRMSGEPYLVHPLEVANMLADMRMDAVTVTTGLLHDVVEDGTTTIHDIEQHFGQEIAHLVDGLTKLSKISHSSREERQGESTRKMLLAMVDDIRVILVKLADRLNNMRTLSHLPREKQIRIAQETLEVYAPIAHRLGMGRIRGELDDLAFKFLHPEDYVRLQEVLQKKRQLIEPYLEEVKKRITQTMTDNRITLAEIQARVKRAYSIYQKMRRQKVTIEQIYDLIAIRIITTSVRDCYAALGVIHQYWVPVPGRFKDWIATPRENGYQSLHTSVIGENGQPFEIQIRTVDMHRIAEEGIAAHWKYKEGAKEDRSDEKTYRWLRHLVEWQQDVEDPREFLDDLKLDLYPKEVFAFTPKGKVIELPRGATPVDFAYAIHSEVGHTCTGAKVNGRIVPLKYQIRNGDVIEIMTASSHHPSRDWLNLVKTNRAQTKIRKWLTENERTQAIEIGKKLLDKEADRFHLSTKKLLSSGDLQKLAPDYGYQKVEDLFAAIGYGKTAARTVISRFVPETTLAEVDERQPSKLNQVTQAVKRALGFGEVPIRVKGIDDLMVYRAQCCNPIRGELIVGYITRGKGVAVHARRCPNVPGLLVNRERMVDVEWMKGTESEAYSVPLQVLVEDRPGALADITHAIANIKTNIRDARAAVNADGRGEITITVEIFDMKHLDRALNAVKSVDGVIDVERIEKP